MLRTLVVPFLFILFIVSACTKEEIVKNVVVKHNDTIYIQDRDTLVIHDTLDNSTKTIPMYIISPTTVNVGDTSVNDTKAVPAPAPPTQPTTPVTPPLTVAGQDNSQSTLPNAEPLPPGLKTDLGIWMKESSYPGSNEDRKCFGLCNSSAYLSNKKRLIVIKEGKVVSTIIKYDNTGWLLGIRDLPAGFYTLRVEILDLKDERILAAGLTSFMLNN